MKVRKFTAEDIHQINSWSDNRRIPRTPIELIPPTGYIVDNGAVGFLYLTDGGISLIEGYLTPDGIDYKDRSRALDLVTESLIADAKELGSNKILVFTESDSIGNRAIKFGFQVIGNFHALRLDLQRKTG